MPLILKHWRRQTSIFQSRFIGLDLHAQIYNLFTTAQETVEQGLVADETMPLHEGIAMAPLISLNERIYMDKALLTYSTHQSIKSVSQPTPSTRLHYVHASATSNKLMWAVRSRPYSILRLPSLQFLGCEVNFSTT